MQFFKVILSFTILTLTSHKCLVYSDTSYNSHPATADTGPPANMQKAPNIPSHGGGGQLHPQQQQQQQQQHATPPPQLAQQQHQQQHQQQQQHHQYSSHGIGGVGSNGLVHHQAAVISGQQQYAQGQYHAPSHSGHAEHKNTYNLLSEAMSQAVSNEFSSLGSGGSADNACPADDMECYNVQDRLGMEAIRTLHQQLDDDDNGNIDLSESDDFLREELKYDSGYEKRQKAFHFNDDMHISVKELWEAWLRSEVHNWTIEQTTDWLAQSVQLPQYVDLFKQHKVSGAALPRLAVNNMHYVSNVLGIKDPIHKQKIALKAMDVVLFGPPRETGTRWKDYILVTLLLSAIIGCWYAYQQNKNAKRHLRRMAQDMEGLQRAEQSLQEMQKELERARLEQENVATEKMDLERRLKEVPTLTSSSSDLEVQQLKKEIEMLRSELSRAEIELVDNCWAPPPQLQSWLQYTYELESKNHLKKRLSAEKQLQGAREACEKLRKKRSSLVGAFVTTHGKSIDDVDRSIVEARNSLSEVTNELQERLHRWKQIEQCLGMNIVNNNGLPYLESVLYGRNGGGSSVKSSRGRITSSSDELDDESVQGLIDGYSRNSGLSGSTILNSNSNPNRDDSSGSEDNLESQSVHFYLGNIPPPNSSSASIGSMTPAMTPRTPMQQSPLESFNHINNHVNATTASLGGNTGAGHAHSDSGVSVVNDVSNRHSPSVSSERSDRSSITVPPRTKKHTHNNSQSPSVTIASSASSNVTSSTCHMTTIQSPPPPLPPTPGGPIGRAPLPPPRKSNQSPLLRSQSSELMAVKDLYTLLGRSQQLPPPPQVSKSTGIGSTATNNGPSLITTSTATTITATTNTTGNKTKKMVKQHSTASQQSTSSTSSSVQSAPEQQASTKQQSPSRFSTSSLERQILPPHLQPHPHFHTTKQGLTNMTFHSLDRDFLSSVSTLQSAGSLKSDELFHISSHPMESSNVTETYHSDTQLHATDNHAPESASVKKRKKGLRFGFGSKKSQSISSSSDTSSKSKHT